MKKKFALLILICTMFVSSVLYPRAVYSADTEYASTFAELQTALSDVSNNGVIVITDSFEITASLSVPAGKSILIKGEDTSIVLLREASFTGAFITVPDTASLELQSIILDGGGYTPGRESLITVDGGTLRLGSGSVLRNNNTLTNVSLVRGGGVTVNSGILYISDNALITGNESPDGGGVRLSGTDSSMIMNGGNITSNVAASAGGGVFLDSNSYFEMNGGIISFNIAQEGDGGGVMVYGPGSSMTMNGGSITANTGIGGGVLLASAEMIMNGGSITANIGLDYGGGIVVAGGSLTVNGDSLISENIATASSQGFGQGGGILVGGYNAIVTINGGSITSNSADMSGGGIFMGECSSLKMNGGIIVSNEAPEGGGIYIDTSSDPPAAYVELFGGGIHSNSNQDIYQHPDAELISLNLSAECPHCGLTYKGLFTDPDYETQLLSPRSGLLELYAKYIREADSLLNTVDAPPSAVAGEVFLVSGKGDGPDTSSSPSKGDTQYVSVSVQLGSKTPILVTAKERITSTSLSEDTPGDYTITVTFQKQEWNGTEWVDLAGETDIVTKDISITPRSMAPSISGYKIITLTEGYKSASAKYTVSGYPNPEVSVSGLSGAEIDSNGTLYLPDGLTSGEYRLIIRAENGVNPEASYEVTVIVRSKNESENSPKTGDSSSIILWISLSGMALLGVLLLRRRSNVL